MTANSMAARALLLLVVFFMFSSMAFCRGVGIDKERGGDPECDGHEDLVVSQDAGAKQPDGTTAYTVDVTNECFKDDGSRCAIGDIHLSCGGDFSSSRFIDPRVFRRVGPGDCLFNDGKPLQSGDDVVFVYTSDTMYDLPLLSARCM